MRISSRTIAAIIVSFLCGSGVAQNAKEQQSEPSAPIPAVSQPVVRENAGLHEIAAPFLWPAIALIALILFRPQIIGVLDGLARNMQRAKVKVFGVEFEAAHVQDTEQFSSHSIQLGEKPEISGDPDKFQLLCKASNSRLAKSTKVMNLENGFLVQVSTREVLTDQSIALAEAIAFVPGLNVRIDKEAIEKSPETYEKVTANFQQVNADVSPA